MTSYISLVPSIVGITGETKRQLKAYAELASNTMADGYRQAADQGGQDMIQAFKIASRKTKENFQEAFDDVKFDTNRLNTQLQHVSRQTQDALNHAFSNVQLPVTAIAQQAQQGMDSGLNNINMPMSDIRRDFRDAVEDAIELATIRLDTDEIEDQVQDAIENAFSNANISLPFSAISNQTQHAVSNGLNSPFALPLTAAISAGSIAHATGQLQSQSNNSVQQGVTQGAASGMTQGIKNAGPAILGAIAALGIGAAISAGISDAMKIESGSAKLTAALGLSPEEAKNAGEIASKLYVGAYGESLEDVNSAIESTMSSFRNLKDRGGDDIENITKKVLNMQSAFEGVDASQLAQVSASMVELGLASDAAQALDLMSAAMQKVPAALRTNIIDALDEYSVYLTDWGIQGEQAINILVEASQRGSQISDKIPDALKEMSILATDGSERTIEGYESLGLSADETAKQILAGGETANKAFNEIIEGIAGIEDPMKKNTVALAFFGTMLEDIGVGRTDELIDILRPVPGALGDITQAAADMDAQLGGTTEATWTSFKRQMQMTFSEIMIPLIKELQPLLMEMTQWVIDNKDEIQQWAHDIITALKVVIVPIAETLIPILGALITWINDNRGAIMEWIPVIINALLAFMAFKMLWSVGSAIWSVASALWGVASAAAVGFGLSTGWLLAIGAAVFALGYAIGTFIYDLWTDFDGVMSRLYLTVAWIGGAAINVGVGIYNFGKMLVNGVIGWINALLSLADTVASIFGGSVAQIDELKMTNYAYLDYNTVPDSVAGVPELATGGTVLASPGGTNVILGEGGRDETVVDRGLMNELMSNVLNGNMGAGSAPTIQVVNNIQKGVADDDETLANNIAAATATSIGAAWLSKRQ